SRISGSASLTTKAACYKHLLLVTGVDPHKYCFGESVATRLRLTEVNFATTVEEDRRKEARVVCEITVENDMLNSLGSVHGGCIAFLLDICTSLPLAVMEYELNGNTGSGVSQNINTCYHAPALPGSVLRFISTSVSCGSRVMSSRCEIWDKTHHRLVASGMQTMMRPSLAKY
ncbi:hypothetical protein M422DRAFT_149684, partial [Sphaerobolus stellatus SS14]